MTLHDTRSTPINYAFALHLYLFSAQNFTSFDFLEFHNSGHQNYTAFTTQPQLVVIHRFERGKKVKPLQIPYLGCHNVQALKNISQNSGQNIQDKLT